MGLTNTGWLRVLERADLRVLIAIAGRMYWKDGEQTISPRTLQRDVGAEEHRRTTFYNARRRLMAFGLLKVKRATRDGRRQWVYRLVIPVPEPPEDLCTAMHKRRARKRTPGPASRAPQSRKSSTGVHPSEQRSAQRKGHRQGTGRGGQRGSLVQDLPLFQDSDQGDTVGMPQDVPAVSSADGGRPLFLSVAGGAASSYLAVERVAIEYALPVDPGISPEQMDLVKQWAAAIARRPDQVEHAAAELAKRLPASIAGEVCMRLRDLIAVLADPIVCACLEVFPGARIMEIRPVAAQAELRYDGTRGMLGESVRLAVP